MENLRHISVQCGQELEIAAGLGHLLHERLHRLHTTLVGESREHAAHCDHGTQGLVVEQQLFAASAGERDVD